jgi:serine/threonine-protein kinase
LVAALTASRASRAQASAEEKAAAEAVFEEGLRLVKQGNFVDACPKFEMSQRVEPAVGTMLYLAECYEKTNRTASSWAMFREAASLAGASGQTERMKVAQGRAARLEPRLAWLTIEVAKEASVPGLQIRRNSVLIPAELTGTPTPVDPGEVVVEASAPGRMPFSTKITATAKSRAVVTIPALAAAPETSTPVAASPLVAQPTAPPTASTAAAPPATAASSTPKAAGTVSPVPFVVGGFGVVALGVGGYFGFTALSKANQARDACPKGLCNEQRGETLAESARTAATVSNVSMIVGAVAVATGAVLYFSLPRQKETQVGLMPMLDQSTLGVALRGRLAL